MKESLNSLPKKEIREINDALVVEAVLRGDWEAFEIFVHKYEIALTLMAKRKLGSDELAREAVQETFMSALRSLHTYNSTYAFRTWLWSILINQCRKVGKGRQNQMRQFSQTDDLGSEFELISREQDPTLQASLRESATQLKEFLRTLPAAQAEALRLRFFEGLKFQEIAEQMHSSLSAAKQRVAKGLQAISNQMTKSNPGQTSQNKIHSHDTTG